jgi:hypothetical protein
MSLNACGMEYYIAALSTVLLLVVVLMPATCKHSVQICQAFPKRDFFNLTL